MKSDIIRIYLDYEAYNKGSIDGLKYQHMNPFPIGSVESDEYERGFSDALDYQESLDHASHAYEICCA